MSAPSKCRVTTELKSFILNNLRLHTGIVYLAVEKPSCTECQNYNKYTWLTVVPKEISPSRHMDWSISVPVFSSRLDTILFPGGGVFATVHKLSSTGENPLNACSHPNSRISLQRKLLPVCLAQHANHMNKRSRVNEQMQQT